MTKHSRNHIDELRGATKLAVEATRGIAALVEKMHVTIASGPAILGRPLATPVRLATAATYASLHGITHLPMPTSIDCGTASTDDGVG